MKISINLKKTGYDIVINEDLLKSVSSYFECDRRFFIITDDGVPQQYVSILKSQLLNAETYVIAKGEKSKSLITYQKIIHELLIKNYSKKDYVIALGGGVVGDLAGYVAATFKRGMRFVNIPTTTLAMVDSSIGGKVAINFDGIKNCIGTYYQPEVVLIDPNVLSTLPKRHINNGMIEALKTGLIGDETLYNMFVSREYLKNIKEVIYRALKVKALIVEKDEKEQMLRKVLNFGHTFGHAYESYFKMKEYLHGEAVGLGLLTVCKGETYYQSLKEILKKMNIKSIPEVDKETMLSFIANDKKSDGNKVDLILVHEIAKPEIVSIELDDLKKYME